VISEDEIDIEAIAREALGPEGKFRLVPIQELAGRGQLPPDEGNDT
jgi:hypothetical protein